MSEKITDLLTKPLAVINIGLKQFAESLEEQQVDVVQVDWIPPAPRDQEIDALLDMLL